MLLAALLLSPHIPLLFMGEEYGETHPFLFFTDFQGALAKAVREGRAKEFAGHAGHDASVPIRTILKPLSALSSTGRRRQARRGNPGCALPATLSYCAIAISSRCSRQGAPWKADPARGGACADGELALPRRDALRGAEYRRGPRDDAGDTGRGHF